MTSRRNDRNHRMTRQEDEADRKSSDMIGIVLLVLLLAGGGGAAGAAASHGAPAHHPKPVNTVCTKYFRGGC